MHEEEVSATDAINTILDFIDSDNIAEDLEEDDLKKIGLEVKRRFDEDWESMKDWLDTVEHGRKLMKQEFTGRSTPWEGASNYKSPLLTEASIIFGDKASLEIMRSRDLEKTEIIGKDKDGRKKDMSDSITEVMNYQINHKIKI